MSGGKFEFDDGGVYVGEWNNGNAEGHGVCTGPNNTGKFEGLWRNGEEVSGTYHWPNGMIYNGQWKGGYRSGYGVEFCKSATYLGEWVSGFKHGSGITTIGREKRPCFEGTWRNGLPDGHGVELYKNGGFYAGQWKEGCRHGYGVRANADNLDLSDGSVSIKKFLQNISSAQSLRPSSFFDQNENVESSPGIRKSVSSPSELNSNNTSNLNANGTISITSDIGSTSSAIFGETFLRTDYDKGIKQSPSVNAFELYKGYWEYDMRNGYGIFYYKDGSKYLGEWKENKKHGYGVLINADGEKSLGKWYADNLLLVTRRKNMKLPMNKSKMNDKIKAAITSSEQSNTKTKLAISRALSARQISETSKIQANAAIDDAEKARKMEAKLTLHPSLQASIESITRKRSPSIQSNSNSTLSLTQKTSNGEGKKKFSFFQSFSSAQQEREPAPESALYAAMDTTLRGGAVSPLMSRMIFQKYSEAKPMKVSEPGNPRHDSDQIDLNTSPENVKLKVTKSISNYLVPNYTYDNKGSLTATTDVTNSYRFVQMKGKLLTGDEVDYKYVAIKANVQGKDTLVLHTNHPKPKVTSEQTISEKKRINSSTGLYRTVVGNLPSALIAPEKSGLWVKEKQDTIDSVAINTEELKENSRLVENNIVSGTPTSLSISSVEVQIDNKKINKDGQNLKLKDRNNHADDNKKENVLSNILAVNQNDDLYSISENNIQVLPRSNNKQVVIKQDSLQKECQSKKQKRNFSTQTLFQKPLINLPSEDSSVLSSCSDITFVHESSVDHIDKPKFGISVWLNKNFFNSSKDRRRHSFRSLSSDSGYKQSIEETTSLRASPVNFDVDYRTNVEYKIVPKISRNFSIRSENRNLEQRSDIDINKPKGRKNANVSIINFGKNRYKKNFSVDSLSKSGEKVSRLSLDLSDTARISSSNLVKDINIPSFYSTSPLPSPIKKTSCNEEASFNSNSPSRKSYQDYVIVEGEKEV